MPIESVMLCVCVCVCVCVCICNFLSQSLNFKIYIYIYICIHVDFLSGPVVKNLVVNAGIMSSIPVPERFHMPPDN